MRVAEERGSPADEHTSAALGTASQKSSILRSPRVVWRVTDCSHRKWA